MRHRILVTGAAGRIASEIVPTLREHFALRLLDLRRLDPVLDDEVLVGDIRDLQAMRQACKGARAMLHLAAIADEDDFETRLLPMNLLGAYTVFEAARQAGLPRLVFASTLQTVLNYPPGTRLTTDMPARPLTVYACTKLFGEALARYYVERCGMSVICLRIGWFLPYGSEWLRQDSQDTRMWCSPGDLAQLVIKSIETELSFGVFFAVSNDAESDWDTSDARRLLGYQPADSVTRPSPRGVPKPD